MRHAFEASAMAIQRFRAMRKAIGDLMRAAELTATIWKKPLASSACPANTRSVEAPGTMPTSAAHHKLLLLSAVILAAEAHNDVSATTIFPPHCIQSGNPDATYDCTTNVILSPWRCGPNGFWNIPNNLFDAGIGDLPSQGCAKQTADYVTQINWGVTRYIPPDPVTANDLVVNQPPGDVPHFYGQTTGKILSWSTEGYLWPWSVVFIRYLSCPKDSFLRVLPNATLFDGYWCERPLAAGQSPAQAGKQCPATSKPITLANGNKYLEEMDVPAVALGGLAIARHFNSMGATYRLWLATNWKLSLDRGLSIENESMITAYRPDGKQLRLLRIGDQYQPNSGGGEIVRQIVDNSAVSGWRYFDASSGEIERYDARGKLLDIQNLQGMAWSLTRNSADRIVEVSNVWGIRYLLRYNVDFRLAGLDLPDGGTVHYGYDSAGNLATVTYPDNQIRTYVYSEPEYGSNLTGVIDENGSRYISYSYDSWGRAIGEVLAGDVGRETLTFNSGSTTVTDPLGTARTYTFQSIHGVSKNTSLSQPAGSGCGPASAATSYDGNGNVARRTDFNGVVTTYTHDLARNLETQRIEAAGTPEARTVSTRWHPDWRLATRIAEPKKITTHLYNGQPDPDNADAIVTCAPADALVIDKPIAVLCQTTEQATTDPDGSQGFAAPASGAPRIWRFTYNRYGQPLAIDGPRTDIADITTHDYWPIDAACPGAELGTGRDKGCRDQLRQSTDPLGHITRYTRYNAHGQLEESIDPNGLVTTQTWDLRQRLTRRTVGDESTAWTYDPAGQLKRLTQPDGNWIDHTYDDAHRLIRIADKAGNRIDYTLDPAGNRIGEDVLDPAGTLSTTLTRSYDALGRIQALSGARQP